MGVKYNIKTAVEGKVKIRYAAHTLLYQVHITLPKESWVKVRENICVYTLTLVKGHWNCLHVGDDIAEGLREQTQGVTK